MENTLSVGQGPETPTPAVALAVECARAKGEQEIPADEAPVKIIGAHCDYSARGKRRAHWFRMVWRGGSWQYISDRLGYVGMNSGSRHQSTEGDVWAGELIACHDLGGAIDGVQLASLQTGGDTGNGHLYSLTFSRRRDGQLSITLPDGDVIVTPDPRRK